MRGFNAILVLLMCASFALSAESPRAVLNLSQAYALALQRSENLQAQSEEMRIAELRYRQALGGMFPSVTAKAKENWQDTTTANSRKRTLTADFVVKQPLFNGFREFSAMSAARSEKSAQSYEYQRARELLYLDVSDLFYQVIAWEEIASVEQQTVQTLEKRVEDMQRRVQLGRSRKGELLQSQSELADMRATLEQTRGALAASRELMAFMLGMDAQSFSLRDSQSFPKAEQLSSYLKNLSQRADVLAADAMSQSAQKQVTVARSEHFPSINLEGTHTTYSNPKAERDWNVFVTFELPIFEGGITEAKVQEQEAKSRQAQIDLARLERSAQRDTRIAYTDFIAASEELVHLAELEKLAKENSDVQGNDYQRGIVSNLDVLDSIQRWQNARIRLIQSDMTARQKFVQLAVAAGRTP